MAAPAFVKWLVLAIACAELPRDWSFLQGAAEPSLRAGMLIKIGTGILAFVCLARGWVVGWALTFVWCVQGLLMSWGEFSGGALSPVSWVAVPVRLVLLSLCVYHRVVRKEAS